MSSSITPNNTLGNLLTDSGTIINYQNDILNILQNEQQRLNQKQGQVDNALNGQVRSIELNESYRKRLSYYTWIVIVIVIAIVLYVLLVKLGDYFPSLGPLVDIAVIIVFSVTIIYIGIFLVDIRSRNALDFDVLDIKPPVYPTSVPNISSSLSASSIPKIPSSIRTCQGQECCVSGEVYNPSLNRCTKSQ
jgi:hypothetical protein